MVMMILVFKTHPLSNSFLFGQLVDGPDVFVSETGHCHLVILLANVVGLDDCGKNWEPIGCVQGSIVVIAVHSCQLLGEGGREGGER